MYNFKYYIFHSRNHQSNLFKNLYLCCKHKFMYEIHPLSYEIDHKNMMYTFYHEKCIIYTYKPENVIIKDNSVIGENSFLLYLRCKKISVYIDF